MRSFSASSSKGPGLTTEVSIPALWKTGLVSERKKMKTDAEITQDLRVSLAKSLELLDSFGPSFQEDLRVPTSHPGATVVDFPWDNPVPELPQAPTLPSHPLGPKSMSHAEEVERRCLTRLFSSLEECFGDSVPAVSDPFEPVPMAVTPVNEHSEDDRGDVLPEIADFLGEDDESLRRPLAPAQTDDFRALFSQDSAFQGKLY